MSSAPVTVPFSQPPNSVARKLITAAREAGRDRWLTEFTDALERQQASSDLDVVMHAWDLSQSEVGTLFGVTRQAVSKWQRDGVPSDRAVALADLAAATEVLERHLRPHRTRAVVRRPARALGDRSLLELAADDPAEVLEACRAMFDMSQVVG